VICPCAGARRPPCLRDCPPPVRNNRQRQRAADRVEALFVERQLGGIPLDELDVRPAFPSNTVPGSTEHLRGQVDANE
jgi:hypothetical protein